MSNQLAIPQLSSGLTKTSLKVLSTQFVDGILESGGELQAAEALSAVENFVKEVKADDRLKEAIRSEISKEGKASILPSGAKLELAETGTKYDYSQCCDDDLTELLQQQEIIEAKIKQRQDMLKTLPLEGVYLAMSSTGEMKRVYPPSKTSTSSYKVTLAK